MQVGARDDSGGDLLRRKCAGPLPSVLGSLNLSLQSCSCHIHSLTSNLSLMVESPLIAGAQRYIFEHNRKP